MLGGGEDEDGNEIEGEAGDADMAREIFLRGYKDLRARGEKEDVSLATVRIERYILTLHSGHYCWKRGSRSKSSTARKRTRPRCKR